MMRLPCEFAHVEVYDVFGTKKKYSDKSIVKWSISEDVSVLVWCVFGGSKS